MAKINNKLIYALEDLPDLLDYLIGSKDKNGKTRNFSLQSIVNLINGVNGKNVIQYQFFSELTPDVDYTTPGAMFTNNNETDVNEFSSLIFNKSTLGNYDLTILFDFLSGVENLFIGVDNPSNPNNFFTFKVTSISNHDDYFILGVESYKEMYIGELSNESIYSIYWETNEWISDVEDINEELDTKLDHGGYSGSGQDLKDDINAIVTDLDNNYYTKPEVDSKISSVYRFRGNVPNYASLPTTGLEIGDVYNALDTDINWAWTGSVWDNLGGTVDISGKEDKSNKQNSLLPDGTGQKYITVDAVIAGLASKLEKGTYTGTAQDLKTDIENIYQPNVLISSVPPTRSVNTFTYPATQYQALINKTIRTNPAQFITTITVASTPDHKRIDLIWFKDDNTLVKEVGVESLTVAERPNIPVGQIGVPVSFINVFGNVVSDPTPVTNEISVQDSLGVEKFKVAENGFMRFKGVSFNSGAKQIEVDSLVPLSAFLDIVSGDDFTATLENSNKPFKTMQSLIAALPSTNGETYSIYIKGGNIPITRRMPNRNLKFIAFTPTNLDFTLCKESNGTTEATVVISNSGSSTWTFENNNISLICDYVGAKAFYFTTGNAPILKGNINNLNWKSTAPNGSFLVNSGSEIIFNNVYDSPQSTSIFGNQGSNYDVRIKNYMVQYGRVLGNKSRMTIDNITKVGSGTFNLVLCYTAGTETTNIGNITLEGCTLRPQGYITNFNGTISPTCIVDVVRCSFISGTVNSTTYITCSAAQPTNIIFTNFKGKLGNLQITGTGNITFDTCIIDTDTILATRYAPSSTIENCITTKGFNVINQLTTTSDLFTSSNELGYTLPITLTDYGTIQTNAVTLGATVTHNKVNNSFKEKSKEVVVRSKKDLVNRVLSSTTKYIIDGHITLLTGEYIQVPAGGLDLGGYGFDTSSITKNVSGQSIYTSPVGGSGNIVSSNIAYYPGLGSVFNIKDSNGTHAIELNDVNFQGVAGSSVGTLDGYRQFTGTTCGFYNLSNGFILDNNWSGFKMTNSNIIGFGSTGTLFKKGSSLLFSNRFYIDLNIQVASGSIICDFEEANFTNNKSLQVVNCYNKVNGVIDDTTTSATFPNITPYSSKSYYVNNIGIKNSNNMPYGISTVNMLSYADDTAAAAGGVVQIGETYIESSTGYFKKRIT